MRITYRAFIAAFILGLALVLALVLEASAVSMPLTVDGVEYQPTKVVGNDDDPTVHYETPDTDPQAAFTERNVWTGNGSEHLPCENGIHWIDNKNVLTISNCLESVSTSTTTSTVPEESTTTTVPEETTTTEQETTTTTFPVTTSTTVVEVTTSTEKPTSSTSIPVSTTPSSTPEELPFTGPSDHLPQLALLAGALIALGTMLLVPDKD